MNQCAPKKSSVCDYYYYYYYYYDYKVSCSAVRDGYRDDNVKKRPGRKTTKRE